MNRGREGNKIRQREKLLQPQESIQFAEFFFISARINTFSSKVETNINLAHYFVSCPALGLIVKLIFFFHFFLFVQLFFSTLPLRSNGKLSSHDSTLENWNRIERDGKSVTRKIMRKIYFISHSLLLEKYVHFSIHDFRLENQMKCVDSQI